MLARVSRNHPLEAAIPTRETTASDGERRTRLQGANSAELSALFARCRTVSRSAARTGARYATSIRATGLPSDNSKGQWMAVNDPSESNLFGAGNAAAERHGSFSEKR